MRPNTLQSYNNNAKHVKKCCFFCCLTPISRNKEYEMLFCLCRLSVARVTKRFVTDALHKFCKRSTQVL